MKTTYQLWEKNERSKATITFYPALQKVSKATVIIFPGGAYEGCTPEEGEGYAYFLNGLGLSVFVVDYSVAPICFPQQLLDARQAVRFVRENENIFGIDKNKIAVMGSSAGGHLTALLCTYKDVLPTELIGDEDFMPNAQILCYPVISSSEEISHQVSYRNLLGELYTEKDKYSPDLLVDENTPTAFIWHTAADGCVNVINSYRYAEQLRRYNVPCEMHIFPYGSHGLALASHLPHVAQWTGLLKAWLYEIGWF